MTHSSLPSEGESWVHFQLGTSLTHFLTLNSGPHMAHCGGPPPRSVAHKQLSSAHGKGDRTFGQAEVFSMEGLVQGVWQWPWQDIVGPLLMAGHLSRGTIGERESRVTSVPSVRTAETVPGKRVFSTLKLTWCCSWKIIEVKNVSPYLQLLLL